MIEFKESNNKLYSKIVFKDFNAAIEFINKLVIIAERLNHHPTIHNTYNTVELFLSTHDAGDVVTEKDWELAREISKIS
ncbi:MAG: 4a-hydroxytetrahydrobiopterin dehydratase [bacterium]|jgi:4a-hydroxytetrahydrobiopterin dehydratase